MSKHENASDQFFTLCKKSQDYDSARDKKNWIVYVLTGWFLIALSTVLLQNSVKQLPVFLNFFIQFLSGTLVLFVAGQFYGRDFFRVRQDKSLPLHSNSSEVLLPKERMILLFIRGFIATGGYVAYGFAKVTSTSIDNSAIFSADAIAYALLIRFALHTKIKRLEWLGSIVAFLGVLIIFTLDIQSVTWQQALTSAGSGILSSAALAIITLMTSVMVQHDFPLRIAFYQCLSGLILASIAICAVFLYDPSHLHFSFPIVEVSYSACAGIIYATALLFFFSSFLYTEAMIITVVDSFLMPFVAFFEWIIASIVYSLYDLLSSLLISIGSALVIYSEYRADKKMPSGNISVSPTYLPSLKEKMYYLKKEYISGKLDQYEFMSKRHEFNQILFEFSKEIGDTDVYSIEIKKEKVEFTLLPLKIKMESDESCRSVPLEMLNFGKYEPEDADVIFKIIKDGDVIFDVGAHIGWYSINFAKRYPNSQIFAFEPIPYTFNVLTKNLHSNKVKNIVSLEYGLSNKNAILEFYYFKGGSALASIVNLIDYNNTKIVSCPVKRLDDVIDDLNVKSLDFFKCDIEGSELFALQGAVKTIRKYKPIIFIELYEGWCQKCGYSSGDVISLLGEMGYELFQAQEGELVRIHQDTLENVKRYNYFFLNRERHGDLLRNH